MSLSTLPISYCTNVHPGRTISEIDAGLTRYTMPMRQAFGKPLAAGLWLADSVVREILADPTALQGFTGRLRERDLTCHTLNAFPFGDFHSERVKENVYLPDWTDPRRRIYTEGCAEILAGILPDNKEGSISTVPLGFKAFEHPNDFIDKCSAELIAIAEYLHRLHRETGKMIRLAIEPEPLCVLETTTETITFFKRLREIADHANRLDIINAHIGVCYDVCHQAVEFEDVAESIRLLDAERIRINKLHISCAIRMENGSTTAREALRSFIEPRYLHQTLARSSAGQIARWTDLDERILRDPPVEFANASEWRVHFHVPIDAENLGPLGTTRAAVGEALAAVKQPDYAPHLEVETYTWNVLPGAAKVDLVEGLTRELRAADELIARASQA
jgi:hypothetical protein